MNHSNLSRRGFLQLAAVTATGMALAACAPTATQPSGEGGAGQPSEAPIEIRVSAWGDVPDKNINDRTAAALAEAHSNLRMVPEFYPGAYYDKVQVNFAGGTSPDLVYMEGYQWQPYADVVVPLDDYIERDDQRIAWPDVVNYENLTTWRGNTYLSIVDTGPIVMFYNKTLFDQAEVPYPTEGWTFNDFISMIPSLAQERDGVKYYAFTQNRGYVWWIQWLRMEGKVEFDSIVEPTQALWTQQEIIDALQATICDPIAAEYSPSPAVIEGGGVSLATDRVALTLQGPWYLPQCRGPQAAKSEGVAFDVVLPPAGSAGSKPDAEIQGHMISSQSVHQDEAWEVMKFWLGEEVAKITAEEGRMCGTPELTDKYWVPIATETYGFENAAAFVQAQLNGQSPMINGASANYTALTSAGGPLAKANDAMFGLEMTAQQAMEEANPAIQELLDKYWAGQDKA
jgi:multiple sugar transport system substrate-binding protein